MKTVEKTSWLRYWELEKPGASTAVDGVLHTNVFVNIVKFPYYRGITTENCIGLRHMLSQQNRLLSMIEN